MSSEDTDRYMALHDSHQRLREIDPDTGLHIPGVVLYDKDGNVADRASPIAVNGDSLDKLTESVDRVVRLLSEVVLHLREYSGEDFSEE